MESIIFLIIAAIFSLLARKKRGKEKRGGLESILQDLFGDNQSASEPAEVEQQPSVWDFRSAENVEPVVEQNYYQSAPPKKPKAAKVATEIKPMKEEQKTPKHAGVPVQVEVLEPIGASFDLRKAVVYAEIMNPKYLAD
ncbi:MAG: hypothetical protein ACK5LR_00495 [Mangrovibacterium sp.]